VAQEGEELLVAVAGLTCGEHGSSSDAQSREQSGRAMADIIMSHTLDISPAHGQDGLGAVQGLNLAFFIDTEHEGVIGWVQVQADNVAHLFDKERIGGQLKTTCPVGLHAGGLKHAMHGGTGDATGVGGLPNAPVRAVGRGAGKRAFEQRRDLIIVDRAGPTGTQLVIESGQPVPNVQFQNRRGLVK